MNLTPYSCSPQLSLTDFSVLTFVVTVVFIATAASIIASLIIVGAITIA